MRERVARWWAAARPATLPLGAVPVAAVLGIFAERDTFVPPETVAKLESELRGAGVRTDFNIYPDVDHAFFNDTRPDVYALEGGRHGFCFSSGLAAIQALFELVQTQQNIIEEQGERLERLESRLAD